MHAFLMKRGVVVLAACLTFTGCGGTGENAGDAGDSRVPAHQKESAVEVATPTGYTVVAVTDGGTISGTVRFVGTVPPARSIHVTDDAEICGQSREVQTVKVGSGGGLADAVISLMDVTRGVALKQPPTPPALDQRGCRFLPHVILAPVGAPVNILNNDPLTHNVRTAAFDNRPVNRAQPKELRQIAIEFRAPEKVKVKCDIHDWMSAWVVVIDHPYHAVSDEAGRFVIENVPAGTYELEIWHETLGASMRSVTVVQGEATNLTVDLGRS